MGAHAFAIFVAPKTTFVFKQRFFLSAPNSMASEQGRRWQNRVRMRECQFLVESYFPLPALMQLHRKGSRCSLFRVGVGNVLKGKWKTRKNNFYLPTFLKPPLGFLNNTTPNLIANVPEKEQGGVQKGDKIWCASLLSPDQSPSVPSPLLGSPPSAPNTPHSFLCPSHHLPHCCITGLWHTVHHQQAYMATSNSTGSLVVSPGGIGKCNDGA